MLQTVGGAALSFGLVGTAAADEEYGTVVDMVEVGADPTGSEPIDDVFHEYAGDDTLLRFPEGRYRANDLSLYALSEFAMVGKGDVTLVPGEDYDEELWIGGAETRNLRIENFTIDATHEGVAPEVVVSATDGLVVRDLRKEGFHDGGTAFGFRTLDEDGHSLIENLQATDGGSGTGVYVNTTGSITFRDCEIEGFADNGLYASHSSGPVSVEGGHYANSNVAQIRLGSAGSSVEDCEVVVDEQPDGFGNMRGIRIADGSGPVGIENCEISVENGQGTGAVVGAYSGGSFDLRNTRIHVGEEYTTRRSDGSRTSYAVYVDDATAVDAGTRTIENVSVTGGGSYRGAMRFSRDDNTIENVCISQSGTRRNGIVFEGAGDNEVTDTMIDVTGEAVVLNDGSTADETGIDTAGSCPLPDTGSDD
ncbi:right-handed parallel beta-helix repeat-containing protein [Halalkalicoccus subterraneus]|uniref:right-handed parallel beta-helix repeat-containing protein n=1 Tax=Halalkalicoccus subterraneus TaxID=2675002 RepID=UPI001FE560BB|nr:right-handed parallel beta-helix repeat-containing protein [Halalkalicoccus subterraneus]